MLTSRSPVFLDLFISFLLRPYTLLHTLTACATQRFETTGWETTRKISGSPSARQRQRQPPNQKRPMESPRIFLGEVVAEDGVCVGRASGRTGKGNPFYTSILYFYF